MTSDEKISVPQSAAGMDSQEEQRVLEETFERYRARGRGQVQAVSRVRRREDFGRKQASQDTTGASARRSGSAGDFDWALMARLEARDGVRDQALPSRRSPEKAAYLSRDPGRIDSVLDSQLKERGWKEPLQVGAVVGRWEDIVGELVAKHCPVESFKHGELLVRAQSSAWAQQLRLLLPEVMGRITEAVGPGVVEKVVVLGPRAPSWRHGIRNAPGRGPRDTYG